MSKVPPKEYDSKSQLQNLHDPPSQPEILAREVAALLRPDLQRQIEQAVRETGLRLLHERKALKPLLAVRDVARTLNVSERTVETLIAMGELRPLWVKGQRRFHPDTVDAYVRSSSTPSGAADAGGACT